MRGKIKCYKGKNGGGFIKDLDNGYDLPFQTIDVRVPVGCGVVFDHERIDGKLHAVNIRRS
jgi:cold shock CspA family protein